MASALLASASASFAGTAYKCVSASGEVTFQQAVCDTSATATPIETKTRKEPVLETPSERQLYEYRLREMEENAINERRGRSEEEKALEHLRNRRASQMGITRKELDRREGWKPRAQ